MPIVSFDVYLYSMSTHFEKNKKYKKTCQKENAFKSKEIDPGEYKIDCHLFSWVNQTQLFVTLSHKFFKIIIFFSDVFMVMPCHSCGDNEMKSV
jgi:hypothetical protein